MLPTDTSAQPTAGLAEDIAAHLDVHDLPARRIGPLVLRHDGSVPVLMLPEGLAFEALRAWITDHVPGVVEEIGGRICRLDLGAREIQLFDLRRLLHQLRDAHGVDVAGLYVRAEAVQRYAERELKLKLYVRGAHASAVDPAPPAEAAPSVASAPTTTSVEPPPPEDDAPAALPGLADVAALLDGADDVTDEEAIPALFEPSQAIRRQALPDVVMPEPEVDAEGGKRTLTLRRTLRSGAAIRYDGDVVVLGDVNPGAQVEAGGHVIVLGKLKGVVHAGAQGNPEAFIMALELAPTQLRIGARIAIAPDRGARGADAVFPEIAVIDGDAIVIEPWKGRLRR